MNATDLYTEDGAESIDFTRDEAFRWIDVAMSIGAAAGVAWLCFAFGYCVGSATWSFVAGCLSQIVN